MTPIDGQPMAALAEAARITGRLRVGRGLTRVRPSGVANAQSGDTMRTGDGLAIRKVGGRQDRKDDYVFGNPW